MAALQQRTIDLIRSHQEPLLAQWTDNLTSSTQTQDGRLSARELDAQAREFWRLFLEALSVANVGSLTGADWQEIRRFLEDLSRDRVLKGFDSAETARFLFSLKRPLFDLIQQGYADDPALLGDQLWRSPNCWTCSACTASRRSRRPAKT